MENLKNKPRKITILFSDGTTASIFSDMHHKSPEDLIPWEVGSRLRSLDLLDGAMDGTKCVVSTEGEFYSFVYLNSSKFIFKKIEL